MDKGQETIGVSKEELHNSERAIVEEFFQSKVPKAPISNDDARVSCTEASCIKFGKLILKTDDLVPADNQGCNSYTLLSRSKLQVVQFRLRPFDIEILKLAYEIHGSKVPRTVYHSNFPLPVYTSSIISGKVHILQPFPRAAFPLERQKRTVVDLGRFVARATFFPQPKSLYKNDSWTAKSKEVVERLCRNSSLREAAPEIADIALRLKEKIHLLDGLPAVLVHHDFSEVNVLVDEAGNVTGVIDFDASGIEAFGMCIRGIYECFLGSMEQGKWSFYNEKADGYSGQTVRDVLEVAFWDSLWSSISPEFQRENLEAAVKVSLCMGAINRYFVRGMMDEIDEIDESIKVHRLSLEYAKGVLPAV